MKIANNPLHYFNQPTDYVSAYYSLQDKVEALQNKCKELKDNLEESQKETRVLSEEVELRDDQIFEYQKLLDQKEDQIQELVKELRSQNTQLHEYQVKYKIKNSKDLLGGTSIVLAYSKEEAKHKIKSLYPNHSIEFSSVISIPQK